MSDQIPSTETEEWRPIADWPYAVSSLGRVKRTAPGPTTYAGRILKNTSNRHGYLVVNLMGQPRLVSRLVCAAFHGEPPSPRHHAAHGDRTPTNNIPANLRWATPLANYADTKLHGTHRYGEHKHSAKLTNKNVKEIRRLLSRGVEGKILATRFLVNKATISDIKHMRTWRRID